jgi:hypothetical protein
MPTSSSSLSEPNCTGMSCADRPLSPSAERTADPMEGDLNDEDMFTVSLLAAGYKLWNWR